MGFSHIYVQMVSTTRYSFKCVFLQRFLVREEWVEVTFQGKRTQ